MTRGYCTPDAVSTLRMPQRSAFELSLRAPLLGIVSGLLALPVDGATTSSAQLADMSLEQLSNVVVSSVSRRDEPLAGASSAVFVITAEDIRRSGATTLPEVLRLAPNLDVARGDNNQYAISARGFNSLLANNMLVLIDGRTVYSPLFSGVFWEAQSVLLEDIERIEVISGPKPAMWGSNAVNGVINVISRASSGTQGTLLKAGAGNRESGTLVRYGDELTNGGHYRVYGKYRNAAHTERADGTDVQDGANHRQAGFRADWDEAKDTWTLQGDVYDADIDQPFERREIGGVNLLARWSRQLTHGGELSAQTYYDRTTRDQSGLLEEELDTFDFSFQHNLERRSNHAVNWGGGYRYSRDDIENGTLVGFLPPDRSLRWSNLFVQDQITLRDDITASVAVKAEHNDYTGTEWLPTARLAWHYTDNHMAWARIARAVRAPSRIDREYFAPPVPPYGFAGGPEFQSEVLDVVEVGFRGQALPGLSYSATVFHNEYDHLRTFEATPNGLQMGNKAEASVNGMEAWMSYRVTQHWRLRAGGTLLSDDRRLDADSTHSGSLSSSLGNDPSHWWSLRSMLDLTPTHQFDVAVRRVGARTDPDVSAYTAVDARLAWQPRSEFELSLNAQNLFDPKHPEWTPSTNPIEHERSIYLQAIWTL